MFKRFNPAIKEIRKTKVTLIFYDPKTIYMHDENSDEWWIFHRWWANRGTYIGGWGDFRTALWRQKNLTTAHVFRLAFRYNIPHVRARKPDIEKFKTIERVSI